MFSNKAVYRVAPHRWLSVTVLLCLSAGFGWSGQKPRVIRELRIAGESLREMAVVTPLPEYPTKLFHANVQGQVSARVTISDGAVVSVEILETAHKALGDSVVATLKKWRFKPFAEVFRPTDQVLLVSGRLVFYFKIRDGMPTVIDAAATLLRPKPNSSN